MGWRGDREDVLWVLARPLALFLAHVLSRYRVDEQGRGLALLRRGVRDVDVDGPGEGPELLAPEPARGDDDRVHPLARDVGEAGRRQVEGLGAGESGLDDAALLDGGDVAPGGHIDVGAVAVVEFDTD